MPASFVITRYWLQPQETCAIMKEIHITGMCIVSHIPTLCAGMPYNVADSASRVMTTYKIKSNRELCELGDEGWRLAK